MTISTTPDQNVALDVVFARADESLRIARGAAPYPRSLPSALIFIERFRWDLAHIEART